MGLSVCFQDEIKKTSVVIGNDYCINIHYLDTNPPKLFSLTVTSNMEVVYRGIISIIPPCLIICDLQ